MTTQKRTTKSSLLEREHFVAEVVDVDDPEKKLRARVQVYGVTDDVSLSDLPWATYWLPPGCRANEGEFRPCKVGDTVWVDFPDIAHGAKDTRRPRITGSVHWWPDIRKEYPELPHEAFMYGDKAYKDEPPKTMGTPSEYGKSTVITHNGVSMEFVHDGSWRVWQRATGTAIEIAKDGGLSIKAAKGVTIESDKDINIKAKGDANIKAGGDVNLEGKKVKANGIILA